MGVTVSFYFEERCILSGNKNIKQIQYLGGSATIKSPLIFNYHGKTKSLRPFSKELKDFLSTANISRNRKFKKALISFYGTSLVLTKDELPVPNKANINNIVNILRNQILDFKKKQSKPQGNKLLAVTPNASATLKR